MTANIRPERGGHCDVVFGVDTVTKTTKRSFPFERAKIRLNRLNEYYADLTREPLPVAPLFAATLVEKNGGMALQFVMGLIRGPSVERLPDEMRLSAVGNIIGCLCMMSQIEGEEPGILGVPVDALLRNWHVDPANYDLPTLVDIYEPLPRDPSGLIWEPNAKTREWKEENMGRLGTIVPDLVGKVAGTGGLSEDGSIDWAMSALPPGNTKLNSFLEPKIRDVIARFY